MLRNVSGTNRARVTAERLAQLQAATAKLAAALTVTDLSHAMLSIAEEAMTATAGVVYLLEPDGELRLQASRGVPAASVKRWQVLPRDAPVPLAAAIAGGVPIFLGTRAEIASRYPTTANNGMPASQMRSVAALPLIHGARVLGGFAVTFDNERPFDEDERRWLTSIAAQAAVAADRARLFDDLTNTLRLNELFVGVLAHDLRSPLAAIGTAAELIRSRAGNPGGESPADPRNAKALTGSPSAAERMARMIEQLLDFTRMRVGGGLTLDRETSAAGAAGQPDGRRGRRRQPERHGDGGRDRRHERNLGRGQVEPDVVQPDRQRRRNTAGARTAYACWWTAWTRRSSACAFTTWARFRPTCSPRCSIR